MFISHKLYSDLLNAIDEKYFDRNYTKKEIQYLILDHYFSLHSSIVVESAKGNKRLYKRPKKKKSYNSIIQNYWT